MDNGFHKLLTLASVVTLLGSACAEIDSNQTGDGPIYYSCEAAGDCASGFSCMDGVVRLGGGTPSNLCLPAGDGACPAPLELRVADPEGGGTERCLMPFACGAAGGVEAAGDVTQCPLGFTCVDADGDPCGACAFVSCDMTAYNANSATLKGVDGAIAACFAAGDPGDTSGYDGGAVARIYCELNATADYPGCPAGWTAAPETPCGGTAPSCFTTAAVLDPWDGAPVTGGSPDRTTPVGPLFLAPSNRTLSCRPSP